MLNTGFTVNTSSIEDHKSYWGADVGKVHFDDVSYTWTMVSNTYVEKYIKNSKKKLEADGFISNKKWSNVKYPPKRQFLTT